MQVAYKISDKMKFTYNNFIGNETTAPTKTDTIGTVYMYSNEQIKIIQVHTLRIPTIPATTKTLFIILMSQIDFLCYIF